MKLLLFATRLEAEATLERTKAKGSHPLYTYEGGIIAISGMGVLAAQQMVIHLAPQIEEIYNLGFAGSLKVETLGTIHPIQSVKKYTPPHLNKESKELVKKAFPPLSLPIKGKILLTSDIPLHSAESHTQEGDLIDMEGYGVAYAAHHLGKRCHLIKIVSDFISPEGRSLIKENASYLSQILSHSL